MSASEWTAAALGDLVDLRLSSVDKKSKPGETSVLLCNYTDVYRNRLIHSGLDFMHATATEREIEKCALRTGDVVITKDSEQYDDIGVPALIRDDAPDLVCGYHLAILRPRTEIVEGAYLFHALNTREVQHQFHAYANGITRFGLRKADIERVQIPLPPLEEQRRIAGVLGALDDKIELNRRMAQTLEQIARVLFRSWFVDFEPVRAKQAQRWSPGQSLPGLPAHLHNLFPDQLEPSPLGPIPQGWQPIPLDEIATFLNGLALQKFPAQGPDSLPAIKIAQLRAGHTDRADPVSPDIPSEYIVDDGDILFSWSGSLELVVWAGGKGALNQHLFKVEPLDYPDWFVYHWVERHLPEFRQIAADKATTMGHIKRHHITDALVAVPPAHLLSELDGIMAPPLAQANVARVASRQLAEMRDRLLHHLTSSQSER